MAMRRLLPLCFLIATACTGAATGRGDTVIYASGADLQSINPLLTMHPLAHQVQRHVLLTTLVGYDSALAIRPYLAQRWDWSRDSTALTFHLVTGLPWDDGVLTTARDAAWTLDAARDPATGYPRLTDLTDIADVIAPDDSTLVVRFTTHQHRVADVFTDLAILPAHLFVGIAHADLRRAAWNQLPTGNGPFRFVSHQPNRRWVFAAKRDFPAVLGGPPHIARLVIAVVDEPTTKLAALTSGELDFAGINPAHASFVGHDPNLQVVRYPLLLSYALVFNTRRQLFADVRTRRAISAVIDRHTIVDGYLFGFGMPATGPQVSATGAEVTDAAMAKDWLRTHPLRFELLTVGSGEAALEQMVQAQLAAAGVRVDIRQLELSAFLSRVQGPQHDFDAAVMGIAGDEGLGELAPLLATAGLHSPAGRDAMLRTAVDSMPAAFLYHAGGVQGMNRRVLGVRMDVRGELVSLRDWHIRP